MAIPATASKWTQSMDPSDLIDYEIDLSGADSLLEDGELIDSYTLTVLAEGVAVGFQIEDTGQYAPIVTDGNKIQFWVSVLPEFRNNSAFSKGMKVPIELEVETDFVPPRRKQRTFVITVVHK